MIKKTTPEIEKEVKKILSKSKKEMRRILIGYIERIEYLEGKEFYDYIIEQQSQLPSSAKQMEDKDEE